MGAITGLLGIGGGAGGTSFAVNNPVNQGQIDTSIAGSNNALAQQQGLLTALQGQNGIGNQSNVYNQLQGVANGTGPNPAQAMLNQSTAQNVQQQAALQAGQRGASSNVGLMARQIGQQGAATQQQAAGQGATLQANQSLNALGQMGGIAGQQVAQQTAATGANTQANQAQQQQLLNAQTAYNTQQAGMANTQMQNQPGLLGGIMNGIGAIPGLGAIGKVATGIATGFAEGGSVPAQAPQGPQSLFAQGLSQGFAQGGKVDAMVSPGEIYLSPEQVKQVQAGADPMKVGRTIPGKPAVGGAKNSYSNDTIPAKLDPGGVVVPRSETKSKNPSKNSASFVQATLAKKKAKK
jgi:hypothetical protein